MAETKPAPGDWIGASLLRREDARFLIGKGQFVADIRLPGLEDACFVRSPMGHASLRGLRRPAEWAERVYTHDELGPFQALPAGPDIPGYRNVAYPVLATDRVCFAGQPIAAVVAPTRGEAEDIAGLVELDLDALPAVTDAVLAMAPDSPRIHDAWPDNAFITSGARAGDAAAVAATAPVRITRRLRMNRQSIVPLEGRAALAYWDHRLDELVVYLSTQGAHVMRLGIAQALGISEHKVHVIAPDVGGGFGGKNRLTPEEIAVCALALKRGHPVRWIEDRREHLMAAPQAREHVYDLTLYADRDGTMLALEGDVYIDAGAYPLWPTGAFAEASMAVRNLTGPYRIRHIALRNHTVATNKPPMGPYRGVARPGACFAMERLADELARELGLEPIEIRRRNMVTAGEMPYVTAAGMRLDNGDYPASLDEAARSIGLDAIRARQRTGEPDGRRIGVGFAFYTEQSGHGLKEWARRGARVMPSYETCTVRMLPDGSAQVLVGIQNHGQGLETTLSQIAAQELRLDPARIAVRHGDTAVSPFGFGTFASRSTVFAGGAVARSCRILAEKIRRIGGHLIQTDPVETRLEDGHVVGPSGAAVSFAEIGRAAHVRQEMMPPGVDPVLEATATYEPADSSGTFSYSTHAALVAVDPLTGGTELLDYVVAEDCGTMVNPLIVDGQVTGGVIQGIGTALYEEVPYDESGQPLATTFADYHMPCATEMPRVRISHFVTPSAITEYGIKGMGEGGAIAPPAAIANALADAFRDSGAQFNETPCTPRRVVAALEAAEVPT
ncbi:xanthine dehydrogenase family protein molybdopterin-binding subunit [Roseomonas sp. NAR14]|uniref:Xanthine dehydrogenase family protein molybdopterin-binding subunit n=1 Tax=Roseomonas acroporae TaxID=2937791 RepID=A0A9X2BTN3_9PROT|nr:xanthine dehydrogenase family protein molybdopterin-binding subunit [Roseomonas acroporae]MCK8784497.1 xanthine dehydrogenase family protein molybdopterin-binding subunit [Roseomonas acroporae]